MRLVCSVPAIAIMTLFLFQTTNAQLCRGSLGDPIVNITFGAGANPGQPLSAATTTYQYAANDCPSDGSYTVRNSTSQCFYNEWHSLSADHTGNANGYFMLVNATYQPGAFYLETVRGLCSNTTFEFAAWVANVHKPTACSGNGIQPNLTFTIEKTDGTVLSTYNSGNIPPTASPAWQQVGFYFTTPVGVTDVVLRMVNNAPGGCGNDIALDDITLRPCGPNITASILGLTSNNQAFCQGEAHSYTFTGTVMAGYANPSLQWQQNINGSGWVDVPGATTTTLLQDFPASMMAGTYLYRLSAVETGNMGSTTCRTASNPISITINSNLATTASVNTPVCTGDSLILTATGGAQYQWTGPGSFSSTSATVSINNAQPTHSGKYYVTVTNAGGCMNQDSVTVTVNTAPLATAAPAISDICQGVDVQLTASGGTRYQWIPATGLSSANIDNPIARPTDTVNYTVVVYNEFSCSDTAMVTVNVAAKPYANAGPDKSIFEGEAAQLEGVVEGSDIYSWSPVLNMTNAQLLNPVVTPPTNTDYLLTVVSELGCGTATDTMRVFVYKDIFVPNAFTPNNDGRNDSWNIPALNALPNFEVRVFNRYGQLVFNTRNINRSWNGKFNGTDQPIGTYVYLININNGKRILKGPLLLIR
ncbi:T9SS type B sorting domain-containing protein [Niastella caeni]|uniref:T9SS type B sorting domain-containing protein n=1 Tax=Niastella caeni TaxID=2569763 RepID=A0A4S8HGN9_9BACT|nr:gliding motility-associated C-terminal domain-containing protein [Niastella caeni]THU34197.1 T9SS type B sorting domain-containing protein [Niastella caeni]